MCVFSCGGAKVVGRCAFGAVSRENRRLSASYHGRSWHEQAGLTQLAQPSPGLAPSEIQCRKSGQIFAGIKANLPQTCRNKGMIRSYGLIRRLKTANNALQISELLRE
ncbi:hypothetical protein [Ruegeria sp. HKCCA4008]|uniref:hypothetical protein n=1 Tax=Ruegeria sp. HKCCA4008 TaxID=2682999 RepID=UPI00148877F9|nr:hypothetical protein [Ruegeria sp. HKCCA4008]